MKLFYKENDSPLDIGLLLEESKDKDMVERRRERLERLKFAEWKIWKFLRITWK